KTMSNDCCCTTSSACCPLLTATTSPPMSVSRVSSSIRLAGLSSTQSTLGGRLSETGICSTNACGGRSSSSNTCCSLRVQAGLPCNWVWVWVSGSASWYCACSLVGQSTLHLQPNASKSHSRWHSCGGEISRMVTPSTAISIGCSLARAATTASCN